MLSERKGSVVPVAAALGNETPPARDSPSARKPRPDVDPTRPREHNTGEKKKQVGGAEGGKKGSGEGRAAWAPVKNVHQRKEKRKEKREKTKKKWRN